MRHLSPSPSAPIHLLLALLSMAAPVAVNGQSGCTILDASTPCGSAWNGFSVRSDTFPTVAAFTSFLNSKVFNMTQVGLDFSQTEGCSVAAVSANAELVLRYRLSYLCTTYVQEAQTAGCSVPPPPDTQPQNTSMPDYPLALCRPMCELAGRTMTGMLTNTTICPVAGISASQSQSRDALILKYQALCVPVPSAANPAPCHRGVPNEQVACGFLSRRAAGTGCVGVNDTCCTAFLASGGASVFDQPPTAGANPKPTGTSSPDSGNSGPFGPSPWIIVGGIAAGLAVLVALAFGIRTVSGSNQLDTTPPPKNGATGTENSAAPRPSINELTPIPVNKTLTRTMSKGAASHRVAVDPATQMTRSAYTPAAPAFVADAGSSSARASTDETLRAHNNNEITAIPAGGRTFAYDSIMNQPHRQSANVSGGQRTNNEIVSSIII